MPHQSSDITWANLRVSRTLMRSTSFSGTSSVESRYVRRPVGWNISRTQRTTMLTYSYLIISNIDTNAEHGTKFYQYTSCVEENQKLIIVVNTVSSITRRDFTPSVWFRITAIITGDLYGSSMFRSPLTLCKTTNFLTLWCPLLPYGYSYKAFCARLGWAVICNCWHLGTLDAQPWASVRVPVIGWNE